MLVLHMKKARKIQIGDDVFITIIESNDRGAKLGIIAPRFEYPIEFIKECIVCFNEECTCKFDSKRGGDEYKIQL